MRTNLKRLMQDSAAIPTVTPDLEAAYAKAQRLKRERALMPLVLLILVGVASIWAFQVATPQRATQTGGSPSGDSTSGIGGSGYSFEVDSISFPRDSNGKTAALLEYSAIWSTDDFPGWQECVAIAYSSDERVLGRASMTFASQRMISEGSVYVEVLERPKSAQISCSHRLDDPGSVVQFSNTRIVGHTKGRLRLTTDYVWTPEAAAGHNECRLELWDAQVRRVYVDANFSISFSPDRLQGSNVPLLLPLPPDAIRRADSAVISQCRPISP